MLLLIKEPIGLNNMLPNMVVCEFVANPILARMADRTANNTGFPLCESSNTCFNVSIVRGVNAFVHLYIY